MAGKKETIPFEFAKLEIKRGQYGSFLVFYQMNKPSNLPKSVQPAKTNWPRVCLDLELPHDLSQLSATNDLNHPNIMHIEALKEVDVDGNKRIAAFLERHDGPLVRYLLNIDMADCDGAVPSQALRRVMRQIVESVEELRKNGSCHGNLCLENIYYFNGKHGIVVKLVNIQNQGMTTEVAQLQDWIAVGSLLDGISTSVKKWHPRYSFLAIDDAARKLMELTNPALLQDIKKETVRRPFFWEPQKRVNFWVHDIPKALGINAFVAKIYNYPNWRLPWSTRTNPQLLKAMNNYRKEKAEKERESLENQNEQPEEKDTDYNVNDPQQYVKCISGAYSHAEELHGKVLAANGNPIPIDSAVQRSDPELCIVLYSLLTD